MATIDRRKDKDGVIVYRARVRRKGCPPQTATFQSLADAKKWVMMTEAAILEGRHFPATAAKRYTVTDLIDRYLQDVLPHKSTSSISTQTQQLHWWKSQLGHCTLASVTPAMIAECRDRLARTRKNSTVRRYLAALSHAFTMAVKEWGWLDDTPMRKVRKPKEPRGRVRFLSDDERHRLLEECRASRSPFLYIVVVLALSTGARKMELLSLTWRNVDIQRCIITLHDTKSGERRVLPLTGYALELMRQHAKIRRINSPLVFPDPTGTKPCSIREAWDHAVRRSKIEDFRFHDLRHSAASYLAMNGASLMEIAEILGHKTLSMVRRYTHLSESHTRNVVAKMNAVIFGG